jgi:hypothetical protein
VFNKPGTRFRVLIEGARLNGVKLIAPGPCTVAAPYARRALPPRPLAKGEVITFVYHNFRADFAAPEFETADGYRGEFSPHSYGTIRQGSLEKIA